jgi:TRAP-type C4-dicarboxylate transport system permease large subunit
MGKSGMADRLMDFANELIGRVRGGLVHVNVMVILLFAGLTGVAGGDIAAVGKLDVNGIERAGYLRRLLRQSRYPRR